MEIKKINEKINEKVNKMENKMENKKNVNEMCAADNLVFKGNGFVEFSYSSQDAYKRFEAIRKANDIVAEAIRQTGGNMPKELIDAYEGLNKVMQHIKSVELDVIRVGR